MKRSIFVFNSLLFIFLFISGSLLAQTPIWGPETFERTSGPPQEEIRYFSVPDASWEYTIVVNSGNSSNHTVSSAIIKINGEAIFTANQFHQGIDELSTSIQLLGENEISVKLKSKPGTSIIISIYGPSETELIGSRGGQIVLEDIATVTFPVNAFEEKVEVTVFTEDDEETRLTYGYNVILFSVGPSLSYEIRINTGTVLPNGDLNIDLMITSELAEMIGPEYDVNIFVQVEMEGGLAPLDNFTTFPSEYDSDNKILSASLPNWVFSNSRNMNGTYEVIIIPGLSSRLQGGGQ